MSESEILNLVNKKQWDKAINKINHIDDPIWNDYRLIHYSVLQNNIRLFNKLVKKKAQLNVSNTKAESIAHIAASNGYISLFQIPALDSNFNLTHQIILYICAQM